MALEWINGQPYSSHFGDVYFSSDNGLKETRHVFLEGNQLAQRFAALPEATSFCIAETGFGTGLNFAAAWQLFEQSAPATASLDFFSVEKFPLDDDELRATLALWPELGAYAQPLLARWRRRVPGWNRWDFAQGRIRLTLALCDVSEALPQLPKSSVDAWFLDGFSPAKNPEMWNEKVQQCIVRASRPGASLATFSSAGEVRRGLQQVGFDMEKVRGFGRKREMVRGVFGQPDPTDSKQRPPRSAVVIGGGVAGCAAAYALAQRGIAVQLLESAAQLASAASGNSRGILHARFGTGESIVHRFVLAAYGHTLGLLDQVLPVDDVLRSECGLLQLASNPLEAKRIARLQEQAWPAHLLQCVDAEQASHRVGIPMTFNGVWFPAGGWIAPPALCAKLANSTGITQYLGHEVDALEQTADGWRVTGRNAQGGEWVTQADIVVVCCSHSAKKFAQFADFPLVSVRGQITEVPQTQTSQALHAVVCGDGYCAPPLDDKHVIGATHAFGDESIEVRATDHALNLAKIAASAPLLHQALSQNTGAEHSADAKELAEDYSRLSGRAAIRCSAPNAMPLVGDVNVGLYCSLAHGTRGMLTAGLCAEILAAQIAGQLPPLPANILQALMPMPRLQEKN